MFDNKGNVCYLATKCALIGLGLGQTIDVNTNVSQGSVGDSIQVNLFGKLATPFYGGEVSAAYGSDGLGAAYSKPARGEFIGGGVKVCVQQSYKDFSGAACK